jgi:response regulator RpfG family c-di-GMP phosphodiesterase
MIDPHHVLCVDDEPKVLEGLALSLRKRFRVSTAINGQLGLAIVEGDDPPAVVVSDLRMPEMDGTTFLSMVRERSPDTVRLLLTGQADVESAVAAVNHGQVFRFLTKPCNAKAFVAAVEAAAEHHRIVCAERVLLEQTLRGSVKALTDILSLANPLAFGRAVRLRERAVELLGTMGARVPWQIEVAAMLSQIGCIVLPASVNEKLYYGKPLSQSEMDILRDLPTLTGQIVENIPRMEMVSSILRMRNLNFDGLGSPAGGPKGEMLPLGARVLKIVTDFDGLEAAGASAETAIESMRKRQGSYDPRLLDSLAHMVRGRSTRPTRDVDLAHLEPGMVLADDLSSAAGALLAPRGQEVTSSLLQRLKNLPSGTVPGPIPVLVPTGTGS